ncbi:AraC family transcriptional regulator [Intrasporangium oryzae NRRL B-24470]|uniref:AraC family transcriptional regulator n=1 Tax=Intrasporangium oryzae NRRL B-24470 TaxID=1386089 RepID=W9GC53_9MICO|nr:GyrI-like domain-containing protein [Intrasporangium oryzae]EWT03635.1 AraC family transcriptional regulator [Intrasporangium oryzae NRRL B-24470]
MTDIQIIDAKLQHTAVVRERVPMDELKDFFARAYGMTMGVMRAQRVAPVGPPFGLYHGMPGETVDVEAGFPVSSPITDAEGVTAGTLPGGTVVEAVHIGPYEKLADTYAEVEQWMVEHELTPGDEMWECYLSDPQREPDPATWRTLVMVPTA